MTWFTKDSWFSLFWIAVCNILFAIGYYSHELNYDTAIWIFVCQSAMNAIFFFLVLLLNRVFIDTKGNEIFYRIMSRFEVAYTFILIQLITLLVFGGILYLVFPKGDVKVVYYYLVIISVILCADIIIRSKQLFFKKINREFITTSFYNKLLGVQLFLIFIPFTMLFEVDSFIGFIALKLYYDFKVFQISQYALSK